MLLEKDLKKLFCKLAHEEIAQISVGNSDVTIRIFDNAEKLGLASSVYYGGNYIPSGVRKCISHKPPFLYGSKIKTTLSIDEAKYQISLNYLGGIDNLDNEGFRLLLEEFSYIADEWRLYLDEHDKNDLIHVRVK